MLEPRTADVLALHPLVFVPDGEDVTVGRRDIDVYAVLPADGAALLQRLSEGMPVADAAGWYEAVYGEPVDLDDFVGALRELGFLIDPGEADPDPDALSRAEPAASGAGGGTPAGSLGRATWGGGALARLSALRPGSRGVGPASSPGRSGGAAETVRWQRLGRAVFSRPGWAAYAGLLVAAVAVVVRDPLLLPRPDHVFFTPYLLVVELTVMLGSLPLVLLHELGHVLAGRRLGLRTRLRLSQRLHYLVIETVMDGLVAVPRPQRWLPMLAGMLVDVAVMAGLTLLAALDKADGTLSVFGGAALALCFATIPRIAWQFYFFLRTDIYHLLSTVLGTVDLHAASLATIRSWRRRLLAGRWPAARPAGHAARPADLAEDPDRWHPRDRRAARWYAPLIVLGYASVVLVTVLVVLPLATTVFGMLLSRLAHGEGTAAERWDAALLLIFTVLNVAVAGILARRRRARDRSTPQPPRRLRRLSRSSHAHPPRRRRSLPVRLEPRHALPRSARAPHRRPPAAERPLHAGGLAGPDAGA